MSEELVSFYNYLYNEDKIFATCINAISAVDKYKDNLEPKDIFTGQNISGLESISLTDEIVNEDDFVLYKQIVNKIYVILFNIFTDFFPNITFNVEMEKTVETVKFQEQEFKVNVFFVAIVVNNNWINMANLNDVEIDELLTKFTSIDEYLVKNTNEMIKINPVFITEDTGADQNGDKLNYKTQIVYRSNIYLNRQPMDVPVKTHFYSKIDEIFKNVAHSYVLKYDKHGNPGIEDLLKEFRGKFIDLKGLVTVGMSYLYSKRKINITLGSRLNMRTKLEFEDYIVVKMKQLLEHYRVNDVIIVGSK